MGRTSPLFGRSLHTQTSPPGTEERLLLGEYPLITGPSACYRWERRGLMWKERLYNTATLMPPNYEKACFYEDTQGLSGVYVENGER